MTLQSFGSDVTPPPPPPAPLRLTLNPTWRNEEMGLVRGTDTSAPFSVTAFQPAPVGEEVTEEAKKAEVEEVKETG